MNALSSVAMPALSWSERNQRWLASRLAELRARIGKTPAPVAVAEDGGPDFVPALSRCAQLFDLSTFERQLLLLCAGVAVDDALARIVAEASGRHDGWPTFAFAMAVLDEPHWDAMSPQAPLRHWRLLDVEGTVLPGSPLRIDERMMHYLCGVAAIDERLDGIVERLSPPEAGAERPDWVVRAITALACGRGQVQLQRPGMAVTRDDVMGLLAALQRTGLRVADLPDDAAALAQTLRLLDREAALSAAVIIIDLRLAEDAARQLARVQAQLRSSPVIVLASPKPSASLPQDARLHTVSLPPPTATALALDLARRIQSLGSALPLAALHAGIADACEQFVVADQSLLDEVAQELATVDDAGALAARAWTSLRACSRQGLDELAQRIEGGTRLQDMVLPAAPAGVLVEIGRQLLHRRRVYRDWGFAAHGSRGLGLVALFAGESGTGKTMAAEAIANTAGLDLYRIDLAGTVSKYIGETEKNLRRIFDTAESSGAVLLFDEADALFGKRSDVKDSHDRYANIETAYLLQRIEAYRGLAILTTNMKSALDKAFLRRIRFVVQFPFPDQAAREQLWRRQFPLQAPLHQDIGWEALARLSLTGGNIHSIALNAAFMAAHEDSAIAHRHLLAAAHAELAKLERTPGTPIGGRA